MNFKTFRITAASIFLAVGLSNCGGIVQGGGADGEALADGQGLDIHLDGISLDSLPDTQGIDLNGIDLAGIDIAGLELPPEDVQTDVAPPNNAPTITIVSPTEGAVFLAGKNADFSAKVTDDHEAATALKVKISDSADAAKALYDGLGNDGATPLVSAAVSAGSHTITFEVTDASGLKGTASVKIFGKTAPGAPVVAIDPEKATTLDALTAKIMQEATDPDGKPGDLTYAYQWFKDGQATENKDAKLAAGIAKKGEKWKVVVTPKSGGFDGTVGEALITIGDAAPGAAKPALDPQEVDLATVVKCDLPVPATDVDGDAVTYKYVWVVDGYENATPTSASVSVIDLHVDANKGNVKIGSKLHCNVVANDGEKDGPSASSADVIVKGYDVCASKLNPCNAAATCDNTQTIDVVCKCKGGYNGDGIKCDDVDECAGGTAGCDLAADCTNTAGAFTCTCKGGYTGDGKKCDDVNECLTDNGGCSADAACTNVPGSNTCACNVGYTGDGKKCDDVNECLVANGGCADDATCSNTKGSNTCACNIGYAGDGKKCDDVNECLVLNGGCADVATCTNTKGSNTCACNGGYSGDGKKCEDINECLVGNGGCSDNGTCTNIAGSSTCACNAGYAGDGKVCDDVNECLVGNGGCADTATCTNIAGSNTCACNAGYTGDGKTCADVNECLVANGGCAADATCTNVPGSNTCACNAGYTGDGKTCADVDECLVSNGGCAVTAKCTNTKGSNTCACNAGYTGDGKTCADVDECLVLNGGCDLAADCSNTVGSNVCTCKKGYSGDGKTCADVNECLTNNGGCSVNGTCANTVGSNTCTCKAGFVGDGKTCNDVNECAATVDWSKDLGPWVAVNSDVKSGWKVNGGKLVYQDTVAGNYVGAGSNKGTVTGPVYTLPKLPAPSISFDMVADVEADLAYDLLYVQIVSAGNVVTNVLAKPAIVAGKLSKNYVISLAAYAGKPVQLRFSFDTIDGAFNGTSGIAISNLVYPSAACSVDGLCTNTAGSYTCGCNAGYSGDGKICTDVNECLVNNGGCNAAATCTNTLGSNTCACNAGYTGDGKTCTDVNECLVNNGGCAAAATCTNTPGANTCACNAGYTGDGKTCTDVNECLVNNGGCAVAATCTNTPGSNTCACNAGYTGDGKTCTDVNECLVNNGGCGVNGTCANTPGSFTCGCVVGYGDCDKNVATGCEINLTNDAKNCNGCGLACGANLICKANVCVAAPVSVTFGTCSASGSAGPTQAQCTAAYNGGPLAGVVTVAGGVQSWTVPYTATFKITVAGAQGGLQPYNNYPGGLGAKMSSDLVLTKGDVINIVVGQFGSPVNANGNQANGGAGGGGGSFVWKNGANLPLVAAGGGGGSCLNNNGAAAATGQPGVIGVDGSPATSGTNQGTNGGDSSCANGGHGWASVKTNAAGTANQSQFGLYNAGGGFGGGSGGGANCGGNYSHAAGGGGGYSGGGGPTVAYFYAGGGGGSYNTGINKVEQGGVQAGNGTVSIVSQ